MGTAAGAWLFNTTHACLSYGAERYVAVCLTCIFHDVWHGRPAAVAGSLRTFRDVCSARRIKVVRLFLRHYCDLQVVGRSLPPPRAATYLSSIQKSGSWEV